MIVTFLQYRFDLPYFRLIKLRWQYISCTPQCYISCHGTQRAGKRDIRATTILLEIYKKVTHHLEAPSPTQPTRFSNISRAATSSGRMMTDLGTRLREDEGRNQSAHHEAPKWYKYLRSLWVGAATKPDQPILLLLDHPLRLERR